MLHTAGRPGLSFMAFRPLTVLTMLAFRRFPEKSSDTDTLFWSKSLIWLRRSAPNCLIDRWIRADNGSHFVTSDPRDPSISWPVTHDPVPDHGMSRSRSLTNYDEFTTIAFWTVLQLLILYTFTLHVICNKRICMYVYGTDPWPTWPIHSWWPIWAMTHCLVWAEQPPLSKSRPSGLSKLLDVLSFDSYWYTGLSDEATENASIQHASTENASTKQGWKS